MKGRCSVCGRMITVRRDGTIRAHGQGVVDLYRSWCAGALQPPLESQPYPLPTTFDLEDTDEL